MSRFSVIRYHLFEKDLKEFLSGLEPQIFLNSLQDIKQ